MIDILGHLWTKEGLAHLLGDEEERALMERIGRPDVEGYTVEEFKAYAKDVGLRRIHTAAFTSWSYRRQQLHLRVTPEEVFEVARQVPGIMYGLFGVNPFDALKGVQELERAVEEMGFVGLHIHPHGWDLGPDHAYYFPYYAKCVELGIPALVSMGHTMENMPIDQGRPAKLDRVALYFPDLVLVCCHTGWPWVEEAIALASKHPNFYLGATAYAPRYWKPEMVHFINSFGQDKVMWGTDFPTTQHAEHLTQIAQLDLRQSAQEKMLWRNAERVFDYDRADARIAANT